MAGALGVLDPGGGAQVGGHAGGEFGRVGREAEGEAAGVPAGRTAVAQADVTLVTRVPRVPGGRRDQVTEVGGQHVVRVPAAGLSPAGLSRGGPG